MYHLNPHCHHLRIGAQWFSFSLIEKFSPCANVLNTCALWGLGLGLSCAWCLSKYLVLEEHVEVISGGQHFLSLNLDPYQWNPETSFLFVFPMLKLFQAFSDGWSFYSWLILVETEESSVWTALGPTGEEVPSAAIFRPSCVLERVARFRTRLFVYSYQFIHKLWYCLPLWHPKAFT